MAIVVTCECGKQFQTGDEYAGRKGRCPDCGRDLIIPAAEGSPYAPPASKPAGFGEFGDWDQVTERTSGKAIASMVLGIMSLPCAITVLFGLISGILAIVFGCLGLGEVTRSKGRVKGRGMAITGIVTGAISCSLLPFFILIALLLPAVQAAREAANRAQCSNNLKQIGLAMHNFASARGSFPAEAITDSDGKPLLSWRVAILPYIEQEALYRKFKLDEPWDSPHNKALLAEMPKVYVCPSNPADPAATITRYQVFFGPGAIFEGTKGVPIREITDGTSNTVMAAEAANAVPWTKPEDLDFSKTGMPPALGSRHPGGVYALFADGSVHFLKQSSLPGVLPTLITKDGGEVVLAGSY